MRARVLLTNGVKTIDLFWVEHTGTDVYCGLTHVDDKLSYHSSGKVHTDFAGERRHHGWHSPLAELRGSYHLTGLNSQDIGAWLDSLPASWEYSGKKSDAVLLVDTRSVPAKTRISIAVGLIEAGNGDALRKLLGVSEQMPQRPLLAVIATSVVPWVCAIVHSQPHNDV